MRPRSSRWPPWVSPFQMAAVGPLCQLRSSGKQMPRQSGRHTPLGVTVRERGQSGKGEPAAYGYWAPIYLMHVCLRDAPCPPNSRVTPSTPELNYTRSSTSKAYTSPQHHFLTILEPLTAKPTPFKHSSASEINSPLVG